MLGLVSAASVAASDERWFESSVLLAAFVTLAGSIVTTVLNNRATLKRERLARRAAPQGKRAGNVFAVVLFVIAGVLFLQDWRNQPDATATSPATDSPATTSSPTRSAGAATCPTQAEFEQARDARQGTFNFEDLPPDGTRMVLQMIVTNTTSPTRFVASICQDSEDSFWYFGRRELEPLTGLVSPASITESSFVARYPSSVDFFTLDSMGVTFTEQKTGKILVEFSRNEIRCVDPAAEMPEALAELDGVACMESAVIEWKP